MKDNKMQITKNESLSKVDEKFCELKNNNKLALMPFIMAGDPNIETTSETVSYTHLTLPTSLIV